MKNHLGNVLAVVSDLKIGIGPSNVQPNYVDYYKADIVEMTDYYPFGMQMVKRHYVADAGYRFGFQGQEHDDEWNGAGNMLAFKYRVHDARLGRFLSIDPLAPDYPWYSPYAFAGNKVIRFVELEGLEEDDPMKQFAYMQTYDPTTDPDLIFNFMRTARSDLSHAIVNFISWFEPNTDEKTVARYKQNGLIESFDSELARVPRGTIKQEVLTQVLDGVTIYSVGRIDPTDVLGARIPPGNQGVRLVKDALADYFRVMKKYHDEIQQFKCVEFAKEGWSYIQRQSKSALKSMGITEISHRRYDGPGDEVIGTPRQMYTNNGEHEWLEGTRNNTVYMFDNMNPKGIPKSTYFDGRILSTVDGVQYKRIGNMDKEAKTLNKITIE